MIRGSHISPALLVAVKLSVAWPAWAADHLDAPLLQQPNMGTRDINDLYVFQSPSNSQNSVLIMTVNPFAGNLSGTTFGDDVDYEFQIDNDNDNQPDITYRTTFSAPVGGVQTLVTNRNATPYASGTTGAPLTTTAGGTIQAGLFEDPFFFDLAGFQNGFNFDGTDAFAGADISAIVLELPSSELLSDPGSTSVNIWARTVVAGDQIDRMGRPAINTALIDTPRKDAFNDGEPATDVANFDAEVRMAISNLGGDPNLSAALLPDVLSFDTSSANGFVPNLNGRQLADDVIDFELELLSGGGVLTDLVDANDAEFLNVFPYLAPANIPEPTAVGLILLSLAAMLSLRRRFPPN